MVVDDGVDDYGGCWLLANDCHTFDHLLLLM